MSDGSPPTIHMIEVTDSEDQEEEDEEEEDEDEEEFDDDEDSDNADNSSSSSEEQQQEDEPTPPPPTPENTSSVVPDSETATTSYNAAELQEEEDFNGSWNRVEIDGLFCPICMEPWTSSGDHQPSCLSCGHLFGISCIKKWLGQRKSLGKCPQCNKKCTLKDVRKIYASRVAVVDEESQKRIRLLEVKCDSLKRKEEEWRRKEAEWHKKLSVMQKKEADWRKRFEELNKRTSNLERSVEVLGMKASMPTAAGDGLYGHSADAHKVRLDHSPGSCSLFKLQQELQLDGARCFDVDYVGQMLIIARRLTQIGGSDVLTKMSLMSPQEHDDLQLPSTIKSVRDLRVSQSGRLALLASTGKKLSIVSMESTNVVINYDLPAASWSCSWDINDPNYVSTGLQNGMVLVFDLRQTERPLESRIGLSSNPVHTIFSLSQDQSDLLGTKKLLTASSVGVCQWNICGATEQPIMLSETGNQGICISLAYCHISGNIVATYRPKLESQSHDDMGISQVSQTLLFNTGHHVLGSHVHLKKENSTYQNLGSSIAYVPVIRLPKSSILGMGKGFSYFACGDESTSSLALQELPSFRTADCLQTSCPIRDVKYTTSSQPGLLCCLSVNRMHFFSPKV